MYRKESNLIISESLKLKAKSYSSRLRLAEADKLKASLGFTLMEIVIATTIFAVVLTGILSLFNATLRINRRTEALRQVTQGMRNFTEFMVKEVRNGQIDYSGNLAQCPSGYSSAEGYTTYLGVVNALGERECFFWIDSNDGQLYLEKEGLASQSINPGNFKVDMVKFYVRPTTDPYCDPLTTCIDRLYPAIQPFVTMVISFTVTLPTGEVRVIPYQTSISTDSYDIPRN